MLLNRHSRQRLNRAGLKALADNQPNIDISRRLALWHKSSGAEFFLFTLLSVAAVRMARHYLVKQELQADLDRVAMAGTSLPLPELAAAYRDFLYVYPERQPTEVSTPGQSQEQRKARLQLIADLFVLDALTDNPAMRPFHDLFDDAELETRCNYRALLKRLNQMTPPAEVDGLQVESLSELLRAPLREAPYSLAGQAAYMVRHWSAWLPENILLEMQLGQAILSEEHRPRLPGPGPSPTPLFGKDDGSDAPAAFSADLDWMASSVLLAKSVYVWLGQLSQRYQRSITTLAEIPDEELACLSGWGFNALWLIGIWERSAASKRIKQLRGNSEAEASAYALHAYRVAAELGGEQAMQDLEQRCRRYGIRLACDVVPNHTGIDSEWVLQHPDWFLQTGQPPYPAYTFNGPDLCDDNETSIRIEDGYWDHSDAAVVCEYHDHRSGVRRYIYHGNDGTHMPWNDTAQLNFLLPEVRQAMSDLIVAIARRFSLIRFDAAMTLARKHFRRLWFPPPGGSAGVPSRSAFWLSDEDFNAAFPVEFWREVVDRINREAPDTLLIAEAFWLMESYFVRNLGMHRVYNSAFMNMLKREENAKYRKILKDILAYNPEILKRYVNFMNNPDEATAVEQFDKGDKYFGVATLLASLPGLPMFGHGQIEGFREKYGMEYRRAYWGEQVDSGFVAHHERQIFPLLRLRPLFAGVEHFSLYDFTTTHGVDENVYAFSNGSTGEKVLVVYNNAAHPSSGRLHRAAAKADPAREGVAHPMPPLWQELALDAAQGDFCRFRNLRGEQFLHPLESLREGLTLHLQGYEHQVFHHFQLFKDQQGHWRKLHETLQGRAIGDLDRELLQMRFQPLWQEFSRLFDPARLQVLAGGVLVAAQDNPLQKLVTGLDKELTSFAAALRAAADERRDDALNPVDLEKTLAGLAGILESPAHKKMPGKLLAELWYGTPSQPGLGTALLGWLLLRSLARTLDLPDGPEALNYLKSFGLDYAWQESSASAEQQKSIFLSTLLVQSEASTPPAATDEAAFGDLCRDPGNATFLGINLHAGHSWFLREGMTALAGAIALQGEIKAAVLKGAGDSTAATDPGPAEFLRRRLARAAAVGYRLDKFLQLG